MDIQFHPGQAKVFTDPRRFRLLCCGRRFGKSRLALWELILASLNFKGSIDPMTPETVIGVMPSFTQARKVLWQPLVNICETQLSSIVKKVNRSEFRIDFYNGKPSIIIAGANDGNGDRLRGLRVYFAALDEFADFKPMVFDEVIRPAMSDTPGSRALFTGTPKGKLNHMYDLVNKAISDPQEYAYFNAPTYENPLIPYDEVLNAKKRLPPRVFRQEYLASFENFPGKIYTELSSSNLTVSEKPQLDYVVMGVDWGAYHPALSILGRDKYGCWYWVEGWSPGSERDSQPVPRPTVEAHAVRLAKKWRVNMTLCDPSQASDILGFRELGKRAAISGLANCKEGYNKIAEGIAQVHSLITQQKLLFVPGLADALPDAVDGNLAYQLHEAYHYEIDKDGVIDDTTPADGYCSHTVDSTRYSLASKLAV